MLILTLSLLLQASLAAPVCVAPDGARIQLEVALTDEQKQTGLMHREKLPADHGMLFTFGQDEILPFWMKNTLMPLDVVWLSGDGKVVEVRTDLPPCKLDPCPKYEPRQLARAALLVNAGFTAAHGVTPGVVLRFVGVPGFTGAPPPK